MTPSFTPMSDDIDPRVHARRWFTLATLCLSLLIVFVGNSSLNVAIPRLAEEFRAAGFEVEVLDRTGRFDMRTLPRLVRSLRRTHADAVMVTHHQKASLALGRAAARLARVPVNIVAVHSMDVTSIGRRALPRWAVNTLGFSDALVLLSRRPPPLRMMELAALPKAASLA